MEALNNFILVDENVFYLAMAVLKEAVDDNLCIVQPLASKVDLAFSQLADEGVDLTLFAANTSKYTDMYSAWDDIDTSAYGDANEELSTVG